MEVKWLARLFLRDLKIGAESWVHTDPRKLTLVKLVLNAYSDGLFDFYTHRGDVRVAVRAAQAARAARVRAGLPAVGVPRGVADPGMPYLDPSIAPGIYVAVQNATPLLSLGELPKKLGPATMVSVGQKYDGERLQLHVFPSAGPDLDPTASAPRYRRDGVEYRIFSRGGNNSTFRRALALLALFIASASAMVMIPWPHMARNAKARFLGSLKKLVPGRYCNMTAPTITKAMPLSMTRE